MAGRADEQDLSLTRQHAVAQPYRQVVERNVLGTLDVATGPLVGLAQIDDECTRALPLQCLLGIDFTNQENLLVH